MNIIKPTLISFNLCPYVQRSVITLIEKGVPYDIEYVDLYAKRQSAVRVGSDH
jgi:glutathione S-transferase